MDGRLHSCIRLHFQTEGSRVIQILLLFIAMLLRQITWHHKIWIQLFGLYLGQHKSTITLNLITQKQRICRHACMSLCPCPGVRSLPPKFLKVFLIHPILVYIYTSGNAAILVHLSLVQATGLSFIFSYFLVLVHSFLFCCLI